MAEPPRSPSRRDVLIALLVAAGPVGLVLATLEPVGNPIDRFDDRPASIRAADRVRPPRQDRGDSARRSERPKTPPGAPGEPSTATPTNRTQRRSNRSGRRGKPEATPAAAHPVGEAPGDVDAGHD